MRALLIVGLVTVLASTGCRVHAHATYSSPPPPRRTVVVQETTHYHDDHCGHHWDGSTWIHIGGHRHYNGCGHYYYGGRWCLHDERPSRTVIVQDRQPTYVVEDRHVCNHGCNHYHDGSRWVVVGGGHRHGAGCGHVFNNNRWTVSVRVR